MGFGCPSDMLDEMSKNAASSEPLLLLFGVLGVLTKLLTFPVGSEPVDVDLLGQKLLRPKTAFNSPQLDFFSGEMSPISDMTLYAFLLGAYRQMQFL